MFWAKAPEPTSATKTAKRPRADASKKRRLKKADFEVDFLLIAIAHDFPAYLIIGIAGSGRGEEPSGERALRLSQIRLICAFYEVLVRHFVK